MAAPTTVLTIVKDMTYRDVAGEEWSNTYAFSGSTPADSTAWKALFDAVVAQEKTCYHSGSRVIKGYGYNKIPDTGDAAVWTVDLRPSSTTVAGTLSTATGAMIAGDQAAWVRWSLNRFNSKGKRVYLRKYFHSGLVNTGGTSDTCLAGYKTALAAYGTFLMGGTLSGSRTIVDKLGNVPIATVASTYITTRTLKRRSKRPPA